MSSRRQSFEVFIWGRLCVKYRQKAPINGSKLPGLIARGWTIERLRILLIIMLKWRFASFMNDKKKNIRMHCPQIPGPARGHVPRQSGHSHSSGPGRFRWFQPAQTSLFTGTCLVPGVGFLLYKKQHFVRSY